MKNLIYPSRLKRPLLRLLCSRLFAVILLWLASPSFAQAQQLNLGFKNRPLSEVFQAIKNQSGHKIFYIEEKVNVSRNVTVSIKNGDLREALAKILPPLKLTYEIINNTIVISKENDIAATHGTPHNVKITGIIYDEKKQPLPGATIMLKGAQSIGTVSDANGRFTLWVTSPQDVLICSFVGYNTREEPLKDRQEVIITMQPQVIEIETAIAVGYYPKAKNSFTGTAVVVKGSELRRVNNTSFFDALKVYDPSFKVVDERGMYGSDPNRVPDRIEIRGQNSFPEISEGNLKTVTSLPIFILDGFEINVEKMYDLDMNRIESVTILKDASASAIYGSRAANGVVVIESKSPEPGALRISYIFNANIQMPDLSSYNLMDAREALEFQRLAGVFNASEQGEDAGNKLNSYNLIKKEIMSGVNTYWLSKPLQVSFQHKHSLFVEGSVGKKQQQEGNIRYQLNLSGSWNNGVMKDSKRDQYSVGTKLMYNRGNLNVSNDLQFGMIKSNDSPYGNFSNYTQALPYHREKDGNGNYYRTLTLANVAPSGMALGVTALQQSPVYEAKYLNSYSGKEMIDFSNNFSINWSLMPELRLKGNFKISNDLTRTDVFLSPMSYGYIKDDDSALDNPEVLLNRGRYDLGNSSGLTVSGNVLISFTRNFGRHLLQGILGGEMQQDKKDDDNYTVTGFMDDALGHISYASRFSQFGRPGGKESLVRSAGAFSNINYAYDNRYLLDLTGRLDGSSLFGKDQQTVPFWSVGVRWNISKEKFMEEQTLFKEVAIRGNVGTIGNQNFSRNQATSLYTYLQPVYGSFTGASVSTLGNPGLECQLTLNRNIGLEITLLDGIANLDINYYNNITRGNLTDMSIAPSIGFSSYKTNMGDLQNKGIDFRFSLVPLKTQDMTLSFTFNGRHNTNIIKSISESYRKYNDMIGEKADEENINVFLFEEGQSMNTIYAVRSLGIDPGTGREMFLNKDGERTFTWNPKDQVPVGCKEAALEGYFGFNFRYKAWDLGADFNYSTGADIYNFTLFEKIEDVDIMKNNDRRALTDRWREPGQVARFKAINDSSPTKSTSRFVQKENKLSLTSIRVSYTLPTERLKNSFFSMLRLSVTANDLFYLSTVKQERGLSYPFARTANFSAQLNF